MASINIARLSATERKSLAEQLANYEKRAGELEAIVQKFKEHLEATGFAVSDAVALLRPTRARGAKPAATGKVPPKYRDPDTGTTWTGRGREPKWIKGKKRDKFAI